MSLFQCQVCGCCENTALASQQKYLTQPQKPDKLLHRLKTMTRKAPSARIEPNIHADFDNGRRGEPKPGCDCVQCFGRCLTDDDEADAGREKSLFDVSQKEPK